MPLAINVGDTLTLLSLKPLLDNHANLGAHLCMQILDELQQVASDSAEGQAMELGWRHDNSVDVTPADYLDMVLKKTCGMAAIYPTRVGALIGTRGQIDPDRFVRFGFFLGAAFQIQDDLLNLFADQRYGKELNGDIWEGKRTLMLIHLLQECTGTERERITRILGAVAPGPVRSRSPLDPRVDGPVRVHRLRKKSCARPGGGGRRGMCCGVRGRAGLKGSTLHRGVAEVDLRA